MFGLNSNNKKLIVLDVGHSSEEKGAYNKTFEVFEWDYNVLMAEMIEDIFSNKSFINKSGIKKISEYYELSVVNRGTSGLTSLVKKINSKKPNIIISLHCNAFDMKTSGTETLYYYDSKESKKLADAIQNEMCRVLNLRDRGIKKKTEEEKGGFFLKNTKAPAVIVEPFFIDNDTDMEIGASKGLYLADAISKGILLYLGEANGEIS